jgi:predicted AAA+ superfamily ATPase
VDEWQRLPAVWDVVRRAVDADRSPGRFLLTGSATPDGPPTHSGAGRIVRLRMRPLAICERGVSDPSVSLSELLAGRRPSLDGRSDVELEGYVDEILEPVASPDCVGSPEGHPERHWTATWTASSTVTSLRPASRSGGRPRCAAG